MIHKNETFTDTQEYMLSTPKSGSIMELYIILNDLNYLKIRIYIGEMLWYVNYLNL